MNICRFVIQQFLQSLLRTITKAKFWRHRQGITFICNNGGFSRIRWKVEILTIIQDDQGSHCFDELLLSSQHHHPYQLFVYAITSQIKRFHAQSIHPESKNIHQYNMQWNRGPPHKMMGPPHVKPTPTSLILIHIVHTTPCLAQWHPHWRTLSDTRNPTRLH